MAVGMVAFWQVYDWTGSLGVAFAGCLAVGFLVGLLNGIIIVGLGIPALIATIGTQFFWRGVVEVIRGGQGESLVLTKGTILRDSLVGKINGYFPAQVIWMVLIGIAVWLLLNRHKLGAHVYLVGDNENSARLMGVNVGRTACCSSRWWAGLRFGGVIQRWNVWYFGRTWAKVPDNTLAAVFLGGTSVLRRHGTILGTFVGCFIIGAIQPGIIAIGLTAIGPADLGFIITVSVAMHTILRKRIS